MPTEVLTVRTAIKDARKAKGLSVPEIADRLGISVSFYYKIEQGVRNPTIELAKVMADTLGRTVDDLFFVSDLDETSSKQAATG